ncbi:MAG: hypothetical protein IJ125_05890, partial [Atopobiaceae bacterium]|nr:hypothetical protein [Atopobiaceae bacterium]
MSKHPTLKDSWKDIAAIVCLVVLLACFLIQGHLDPQSPISAVVGIVGIVAGALVLIYEASHIAKHLNRAVAPAPSDKDDKDDKDDKAVRPDSQELQALSGDAIAITIEQEDSPTTSTAIERSQTSPQLVSVTPPHELTPTRDDQVVEVSRASKLYEAFLWSLFTSHDPEASLKAVVGDIRTREAKTSSDPDTQVVEPTGIERYLARLLEEAGLFASDIELPPIDIGRHSASGLVYVHAQKRKISYLAHLRIMEIESALRRVGFALAILDDPDAASEQDCIAANQRLDSSLCAQLSSQQHSDNTDDPIAHELGEFHFRDSFVRAQASLSLPYRLSARFRANARDGRAAIQFEITPASVFPKSYYNAELNRILPSTKDIRERAASDYALRLGIILAAQAFESGPELTEVYVAGVLNSSTKHTCHLWTRFERTSIQELDLTSISQPIEIWRASGATLDDRDGILYPIVQGFSLEEERFCPARRYDSLLVSEKKLDEQSAERLGTREASGLSIDESEARELIADTIARQLTESTEDNVRIILEVSRNNPDPTISSAAQRTVERLIDGSIDGSDVFQITDEFVSG